MCEQNKFEITVIILGIVIIATFSTARYRFVHTSSTLCELYKNKKDR